MIKSILSLLLVFLCISFSLFAQPISTFYGVLEVNEPVLLELIESTPMQRLKGVHQYGIAYYNSFNEEYNRYDHSLGVFAILRMKGCSLHEQIAGLLHDVSHTVFSHVGDFIFNGASHQDSYQDTVHEVFFKKYGLEEILKKHGISIKEILPKNPQFTALEQELPNLCADRIDYNLQGAFHRGTLTKKEIMEIIEDLQFKENKWVGTKPHLMKKVVQFSVCMSRDCWGSAENYLQSKLLAEAISKSLHLGHLCMEDIHFGRDDVVWKKLNESPDPMIQNKLLQIKNVKSHFSLVDEETKDLHVCMKFRGVDPWMEVNGKRERITEIDKELACEYESVKTLMKKGWNIKLRGLSGNKQCKQ